MTMQGEVLGCGPRATPTIVAQVMTRKVHTCRRGDTLHRAARLMWDHDCGAVPIVDERGHTVGMITDRDICMAVYIQGRPLWAIPVTVAASSHLHAVRPDASLDEARHLMARHRVRRLPVLDLGGNLVGIVSLGDLVRNASSTLPSQHPLRPERLAATMADVFRPHR